MRQSGFFSTRETPEAGPRPRSSLLNTLAELRALAEIGSFYGARRLLARSSPRGDGHPVMVLPGFMASDALTRALRDFLATLGYEVHPWELGRNPGLRLELCEKLEARIARIRAASHRRVSLIGWSLGGLYARAISHRMCDDVRQVITLGTPFNVSADDAAHGAIARAYVKLNPDAATDPLMASGLVRLNTPVPSTSIFSMRDGIVPWQRCVENGDERTENIRVGGSHCGMTYNPVVLSIIAERLGQREHGWRPFRPAGLKALLSQPVSGLQAA
jgi:hypothetical protein